MPGLLENIVGGASNWINNALFDPGSKDRKMQTAFAKNAIQWKVADANKAGVHPLYALGAPTMNYQPVSVGGGGGGGFDVSGMGQDISRAIGAGMPKAGQISAYEQTIQDLTLKGMGLDNEYKAAQIARLRNEMLVKPALPPFTMPGGSSFQPGPQTPAQKWQDQYGDVIESAVGVPSFIYDSFTNLDKYMSGNFMGAPWKHSAGPLPRPKGPPSYGSYYYSKTGRR